ncbi:hypothetical protein K0504_04705 [Neiella marina]|uniref:Uncharacterized protein n=1 Tax=Neiella holothuriorum TaxID=2870530 RepID=A0ABS7EEG9_9GAMM|nr:hypothetical protein [Neiella holothuriorum]MBW8190328.1 hypothetical protein [Neiella holothuriorum]
MAALLVTFRLDKTTSDPDYVAVIKVIKLYPFCMIGEGAVAIATDESPTQVFLKFKPYVNERDTLLITTITKPHYGLHKASVLQWLEEHAVTPVGTPE